MIYMKICTFDTMCNEFEYDKERKVTDKID